MEIEYIRTLMMRVTQAQKTTAGRQESFRKRKTKADCENIAGGDLQNKV